MDEDSPLRVEGRSYHDQGLDGYQRLFTHCNAQEATTRVVMEATPDYLYQKTARDVLAALRPRPQIVFLLRKPSSRVYSHYRFASNNMSILPKSISFSRFVEAARSVDDPLLRNRGNLKNVLRQSSYVDYVESWVESFGRDGIHVETLESMQRDERDLMRRITAAIGLDRTFYDEYGFPRENETYEVRSQFFQRVRRAGGRHLSSRRLKDSLKRAYSRLNLVHAIPLPDDEERQLLHALDDEFASSVRRLEILLDMDLSAWS